jgi:ketosteroid isomerase-like protein
MKLFNLFSLMVFAISITSLARADVEHHKVASEGRFINVDSPAGLAVERFHKAFQEGDKKTIRGLLADDAMIVEGGIDRSADIYASGHLKEDIVYFSRVTSTAKEINVSVIDDIAIAVTVSHASGVYKNEDVDELMYETLVLKNNKGQWKIAHIHWSS